MYKRLLRLRSLHGRLPLCVVMIGSERAHRLPVSAMSGNVTADYTTADGTAFSLGENLVHKAGKPLQMPSHCGAACDDSGA